MAELLFELVGPDYGLAEAEVKAVIEGSGYQWDEVACSTGVSVLKTDCPVDLIGAKAGLTHRIFEHFHTGNQKDILQDELEIDLPDGTAKVETRRVGGVPGDTQRIKSELGDRIDNPIDLEDPDNILAVLISDRCHVGRLIHRTDKGEFRSREVKYRPYFSPVSLQPRYARALVNLTRATKDLHDPFCGTGGILLEALMIGLQATGGDIDPEMIRGCRLNLKKYGFHAQVKVGDVEETIPKHVESIATDPPYGRAASTSGEEMDTLYKRFFDTAEHRLKKGGRLAVILPDMKYVKMVENLELTESYITRVHSSLKRHYLVFKKI